MTLKVALCFNLNYDHILIKEQLWRKWIEPNADIINVYFFYKDYNKITSTWIKDCVIPDKYITKTSYYFVMPASILQHSDALFHEILVKIFFYQFLLSKVQKYLFYYIYLVCL